MIRDKDAEAGYHMKPIQSEGLKEMILIYLVYFNDNRIFLQTTHVRKDGKIKLL